MLREYIDKSGVTWRVWDVYPSRRSRAGVTTASPEVGGYPNHVFTDGWLCFECTAEKRRLAPIPVEWETCDGRRLEQLCKRAGRVSRTGKNDAIDGESATSPGS
jgi:hypothetical protein